MLHDTRKELPPEEKESTISTPATSMYEDNQIRQKAEESSPDHDTNEGGGTADVGYASGFKLLAVVVALALSVFLVSLDLTIVATAIPKITDVSSSKQSTKKPKLTLL